MALAKNALEISDSEACREILTVGDAIKFIESKAN